MVFICDFIFCDFQQPSIALRFPFYLLIIIILSFILIDQKIVGLFLAIRRFVNLFSTFITYYFVSHRCDELLLFPRTWFLIVARPWPWLRAWKWVFDLEFCKSSVAATDFCLTSPCCLLSSNWLGPLALLIGWLLDHLCWFSTFIANWTAPDSAQQDCSSTKFLTCTSVSVSCTLVRICKTH